MASMRPAAALLLMLLNGTAAAQALAIPQPALGGATLNTSNVINLNSQAISGGSLTLGGGGVPAAPAITTKPIVNQSAGSITLRAGGGLSTLQAAAPKPLTVSGTTTAAPATSFLSAEATRLTLTAMPANLQSLPQLREGVFVQPGTALTGTLGARQAVLIDGRIRFTQ